MCEMLIFFKIAPLAFNTLIPVSFTLFEAPLTSKTFLLIWLETA